MAKLGQWPFSTGRSLFFSVQKNPGLSCLYVCLATRTLAQPSQDLKTQVGNLTLVNYDFNCLSAMVFPIQIFVQSDIRVNGFQNRILKSVGYVRLIYSGYV